MPRVANLLTQPELFARMAKALAHIAPQRRITPIAAQSFTSWFRRRPAPPATGDEVILWPDTFTNYFQPDVAKAAVEVLEHAGATVRIPGTRLCCGRPLYEFGMLARARQYLQRVMEILERDIHAGTPIIGLEPACVSVFRDELPNLFPHHEQAMRLQRQVFLLSEFLERRGYASPAYRRAAIVQAHCHHKALLKTDAEEAVMRGLGLDYRLLDSGCCGMAGSFGFEQDKYEVSLRCAERVLVPAVRNASPDTLVIADGFSCREQITQTTGHEAVHLAQVLQMALQQSGRP